MNRRKFLLALGGGTLGLTTFLTTASIPYDKLFRNKTSQELIEKFLDITISKYSSSISDKFIFGDTHCHTTNSDGYKSAKTVLDQASRRGMKFHFLTEHLGYSYKADSFLKSVKEVHEYTQEHPLKSLPSVEISTKNGHVIAVFPEEYFTNGELKHIKEGYQSSTDTLKLIKSMGGLSIIAHPDTHHPRISSRKTFGDYSMPKEIIEDNIDNIDAIEKFNSMNPSVDESLADRFNKNEFGGSDSHLNLGIGTCFTLVKDKGNLFDSLKYGKTKAMSPLYDIFGKSFPKKIEGKYLNLFY